MQERASVFDASPDFDVAGFVPQKPKASAPQEKVRQVSESASFKSREPVERKAARREPRRYRTGRNTQFNIKADPDVIEESYLIADAQGWVLRETLAARINLHIAEGEGRGVRLTLFREAQAARGFRWLIRSGAGERFQKRPKFAQSLTQFHIYRI